MEIGNPNSIHALNRFEDERYAEQKYNHFRLIDLTREELYSMGVPAILDDDEEKKEEGGGIKTFFLTSGTVAGAGLAKFS